MKRFLVGTTARALVDKIVLVSEAALLREGITPGERREVSTEELDMFESVYEREAIYVPAGSSYNTILTAAHLGVSSVISMAVAADPQSSACLAHLNIPNITTLTELRPDRKTGRILVLVEPSGRRTFLVSMQNSVTPGMADIEAVLALSPEWYLMSGYVFAEVGVSPDDWKGLFRRFSSSRIVLSLSDPGIVVRQRETLSTVAPLAAIIVGNVEEFCAFLQVSTLKDCLETVPTKFGASIVVITAGNEGCILIENGEVASIVAAHCTVLDTNGAGDAFLAGFLAAVTRGVDYKKAALAANYVAARMTEVIGPQFRTGQIAEMERGFRNYL